MIIKIARTGRAMTSFARHFDKSPQSQTDWLQSCPPVASFHRRPPINSASAVWLNRIQHEPSFPFGQFSAKFVPWKELECMAKPCYIRPLDESKLRFFFHQKFTKSSVYVHVWRSDRGYGTLTTPFFDWHLVAFRERYSRSSRKVVWNRAEILMFWAAKFFGGARKFLTHFL